MQYGRSRNGQFQTRWEQTSPEQINFLCHSPVGNCSIIDPVADDGGVGSRRYSVARGHSYATNCDRKHLDIRARLNGLLGSNIRSNIIFELSMRSNKTDLPCHEGRPNIIKSRHPIFHRR